MNRSAVIEKKATPYAVALLLTACVATPLAALVFLTPYLDMLRLPLAYCLILVLAGALYITWVLCRLGLDDWPVMPLVLGIIPIVTGIAFDSGVTAVKDPALIWEANRIVRFFLASGHSVEFVYIYGTGAQTLLAVLMCLMWAAFLRHRRVVIDLAWRMNPESAKEFVCAVIYGTRAPPLILLAKSLSNHRRIRWYLVTQPLLALVPVASVGRLYCGMEWLGVRFISREVFVCLAGLLAGSLYVVWLWREYTKGRASGLID